MGNVQESRTRGHGMGIRRVRVRGSQKHPTGHLCPSLGGGGHKLPSILHSSEGACRKEGGGHKLPLHLTFKRGSTLRGGRWWAKAPSVSHSSKGAR